MYNSTKAGVDVVDQMCTSYSTSRRTRRWPLVLFFRLLDIAGINSQIVFSSNNQHTDVVRRQFLREVGLDLIKPTIQKRTSTTCIPRTIREKAAKMIGEEDVNSGPSRDRTPKPGRCVVCPRKKDIKTKSYCVQCLRIMCLKHTVSVCKDCHNNQQNESGEDSS